MTASDGHVGSTPVDGEVGDATAVASAVSSDRDPLALGREYVAAVRRDAETDGVRRALADLAESTLDSALADDDAKRAFWLNVYNASVQDLLERDPSLFEQTAVLRRRPIFTRPLLTVAGHDLSVDDVEHGILRHSQQAWGLGYVPRLWPGAFEREHRVCTRDPRVHFALNCGAASCPCVRAYHSSRVDAQLDAATERYLATELEYDAETDVASVPRLFSWYRGDFGGKTGIREFLHDHDAVPETATPSLRWQAYDWSLKLGRYAHTAP